MSLVTILFAVALVKSFGRPEEDGGDAVAAPTAADVVTGGVVFGFALFGLDWPAAQ
jgi:hypothetical protein